MIKSIVAASRQPIGWRRWISADAGRLLVGAVLLVCAYYVVQHASQSDFTQDYAAAQGWRLGLDPNGSTAALLAACCAGVHAHPGIPQTAHPPLATLMMLPLTVVSWATARQVWLLLTWITLMVGWQHSRISPILCCCTAGYWLVALALGAFEPILFLLLALTASDLPRAPMRAGAWLGCAIALKTYPAVLLIGLWLAGRRRAVLVAIASAIVWTIVAELVLGSGTTRGWLHYVPVNTLHQADHYRNLSLVRVVRILAPTLSPTLAAALLCVLLVVPLLATLRRGDGFQAILPVMLLVSPICWEQYLGHTTLGQLGWIERGCFAVSSLLIAAVWLGLLPADQLAPLAYGLPLCALLITWYRHVRAARHLSQSINARV